MQAAATSTLSQRSLIIAIMTNEICMCYPHTWVPHCSQLLDFDEKPSLCMDICDSHWVLKMGYGVLSLRPCKKNCSTDTRCHQTVLSSGDPEEAETTIKVCIYKNAHPPSVAPGLECLAAIERVCHGLMYKVCVCIYKHVVELWRWNP